MPGAVAPRHVELTLCVGIVDQADPVRVERAIGDHVRERGQPRAMRWFESVEFGCATDRTYEYGNFRRLKGFGVGRAITTVGHGSQRRRADAEPGRVIPAVDGTCRTRCLEGDRLVVSETHDCSPGKPARQQRCAGVTDDVVGIGGVLHTQRNAKVGVCADVITDHAARALRRQYEMHPEASPALRDAQQRTDEIGLLDSERRELVDHNDESRQPHSLVCAVSRLRCHQPIGREIHGADIS